MTKLRQTLIAGTAALFGTAAALPAFAADTLTLPSLGSGKKGDPYSCGNHESLVGQYLAAVDVDALKENQAVRLIQSGKPVTNDYHSGRLNLHVNLTGQIVKVSCY